MTTHGLGTKKPVTEEYQCMTRNEHTKTSKQIFPSKDDIFWIVRISERRNAKAAREDYMHLCKDMSNNRKGVWDKDSKNKMSKGDWFGFILGPTDNANIHLYYIEAEETETSRPSHWKQNESYTDQNTSTKPNMREVVVFRNQEKITISWNEWKQNAGYKPKYTPRGTTKSKNGYPYNAVQNKKNVKLSVKVKKKVEPINDFIEINTNIKDHSSEPLPSLAEEHMSNLEFSKSILTSGSNLIDYVSVEQKEAIEMIKKIMQQYELTIDHIH